ncbi:MAG: amidase family protein [Candidatus Hydrogenedentota bacterium]
MSRYDLESLSLPILKGGMLRAVANAVERPVTRRLLLRRLLKIGGITRFREVELDSPPLFYPLKGESLSDGDLPGSENTNAASAPRIQACADRPSNAPTLASIGDYARAYASATTNPSEVAERFLAALEADSHEDKPLNAFIAVDAAELRRLAKLSTERHESECTLGPLDGVPVVIKDQVDMVPYPTTAGTNFLGQSAAGEDATTVARLRAAGALLLGKGNMNEIGMNPTGHNVYHGHTRNPFHRDYDTGGSSSGPAAATAAGLCPISLGTDEGGSIRIPAAHCGLIGLKATFGRVSSHGAAPLPWSLGHVGPIGAHTQDVALAYATIAGPDPADPHTLNQPPVLIDGWDQSDLKDVKLGVYWPWFRHADQQIVSTCEDLLTKLAERGATVEEVEIPNLDALRMAHVVTALSEMASSMSAYAKEMRSLAPSTRINLALAGGFTSNDYIRAQRIRARAMADFEAIYASVDALVTPATGVTAPPIPPDGAPWGVSDLGTTTENMRYMAPANMLGFPAISFPAGYTRDGLPIGMQAMTSHWREHLLLRISHVAEQFVERRKPEVYYDLLHSAAPDADHDSPSATDVTEEDEAPEDMLEETAEQTVEEPPEETAEETAEETVEETAKETAEETVEDEEAEEDQAEPERVNINTAPLEELTRIRHVGPARAEKLIELRPFDSLDQLSQIDGIGPAALRDIREEGVAHVE